VHSWTLPKVLAGTVFAVLPLVAGCQPAQDGNASLVLLQAFVLDFVRQAVAAFLL